MKNGITRRAAGCLMGQIAGDSLGALVEFRRPEEISLLYPHGVRDLVDGGVWNLLAGQPTDDSEMALALARALEKEGRWNTEAVRAAYMSWFRSNSFGCGKTITRALRDGRLDPSSQANGALMRVCPIGIFGAREGVTRESVAAWAAEDAALTHSHPVCVQASQLFAAAIAEAVREGGPPEGIYRGMREHARALQVHPALEETLDRAAHEFPSDYVTHQGWALIAFHNAVSQLLRAPNAEEGIIDTVARGGDTDTNAAIAGALLGAVYGLDALPARWKDAVMNCRPSKFLYPAGIAHPRPRWLWPVDAPELAAALVIPPDLRDCLQSGLAPMAHDKPSPFYFTGKCPDVQTRALLEWGLIEWDEECGLHWPTKLGTAIVFELPRIGNMSSTAE